MENENLQKKQKRAKKSDRYDELQKMKPRFIELLDKFRRNYELQKASKEKGESPEPLISDNELLELAACVAKYANMQHAGVYADYDISEGKRSDFARFYSGTSEIGLDPGYLKSIRSGNHSFQHFADTILHENTHFRNEKFMDDYGKWTKQFSKRQAKDNESITEYYEDWVYDDVNYDYNRDNAKLAMEEYIEATGKDRLYFQDEYKEFLKKFKEEVQKFVDERKDEFDNDDFRVLKREKPDYLEVKLDYIRIVNKLMEEGKQSEYFSKINEKGIMEYISRIENLESQEHPYGYKDSIGISHAIYSLNKDEVLARDGSAEKQRAVFNVLAHDKDVPEEVRDFLMNELNVNLVETNKEEQFSKNLNTARYEVFLENAMKLVNSPDVDEQKTANLQRFVSDHLGFKENAIRTVQYLKLGKSSYAGMVVDSIDSKKVIAGSTKNEKDECLEMIFKALQEGELGDIDLVSARSFVRLFGTDKIVELSKAFAQQGKPIYSARFMSAIMLSYRTKQQIESMSTANKDRLKTAKHDKALIEKNVLPLIEEMVDKFADEINVIDAKTEYTSDDMARLLEIRKSLAAFIGSSLQFSIKNKIEDLYTRQYAVINKFSGFYSEDEYNQVFEDVEDKLGGSYVDEPQSEEDTTRNEDIKQMIYGRACKKHAKTLYEYERERYGYAFASKWKADRMDKFFKTNHENVNINDFERSFE